MTNNSTKTAAGLITVQNTAAGLITGNYKYNHISPILQGRRKIPVKLPIVLLR